MGAGDKKVAEVLKRNFSSCAIYGNFPSLQRGAHSLVGSLPGMRINGAGRVADNLALHLRFYEEVPEHVFACRRAADVTPAHKEDAEFVCVLHGGQHGRRRRVWQEAFEIFRVSAF